MVGVKTHLEAKPIVKWRRAIFRNSNEAGLWSSLGLLCDTLYIRRITHLTFEAF